MCVQDLQSGDLHNLHLLMFDVCCHESTKCRLQNTHSCMFAKYTLMYVHCVQGTFIFYKV